MIRPRRAANAAGAFFVFGFPPPGLCHRPHFRMARRAAIGIRGKVRRRERWEGHAARSPQRIAETSR
jgi:hypothetical protein